MTTTIKATVLQTPESDRLEVLEDALITVDDGGVIASVEPQAADGRADIELDAGSILLPGLIDTHLHAPQWPQRATGLDLPLEEWLFEHTFPLEARFADEVYARRVWDSMVPHLLASGTTTAVYYGSIHTPATTALAEACIRHGQRAFVGRVAMDHPEGCPEWYRDEGASEAVAATVESIDAITALGVDRVRPIITPRFIPACTDALLEGLGELAIATGELVQSHCSESDWQHGYVLERCGRSDAEALIAFGLARDHSVLAHATHLDDDDRKLLIDRGAGVAHCPLSNAYFANAVFPAKRSLTAGLRVGLGTDIAGGPEASLLAQCAHAVTASRLLEDGVDVTKTTDRGRPGSRIDITTAFWMATVGGAELLGIPAGLLSVGRVFDAIAVDLNRLPVAGALATGSALAADAATGGDGTGHAADLDPAIELERIVRTTTPGAIDRIWVNGRDVTPVTIGR